MRAKVIWYFIFLIGNNFVFFSLGFISICQCLFGFLMEGVWWGLFGSCLFAFFRGIGNASLYKYTY